MKNAEDNISAIENRVERQGKTQEGENYWQKIHHGLHTESLEDFEDFIESFEALDFRDVMEAEEELADPTPEEEEDVSLERFRE